MAAVISAAQFQREPISSSELVVGMKCGGSDGLSGITANPTIGRFSDMLCARGGSTVLTEVPEMFGAEGFLIDRCQNEKVFEKAVHMINGFKEYFISHNEVVYDNPSPGNKQGGITTLEDKSCGCVQKGGSAPIMDVIGYGDAVTTKGLNMLYGPGNDLVSATALTAAGAHMILFSTGRGTPFGAPAPTLKIATNSQLAAKKSTWIDFNAGVVADGEKTLDEAGADLYVFSNEAGLGAGGISAAAAQTDDPVRQGYISMTGVFVDTMVICLVTGLAVGVTGAAERAAEAEKADGAAMVIRAFESVFGPAGGYLVTIGILLFAFATMAGWAYQGEQAFVWLVKKESFGMVYRVFFCFAASAGCVCMAEIVWNFAELANACMAVPNLICVLRLWKTVKEGAVRFESSIKKSEQRKNGGRGGT